MGLQMQDQKAVPRIGCGLFLLRTLVQSAARYWFSLPVDVLSFQQPIGADRWWDYLWESIMRRIITAALALAVMLGANAVAAAPLKLTPANPQPKPKPGLTVRYAYPSDVKSLSQARSALKRIGEPGPMLSGLDYSVTDIGEKALTSKRSERVAADIRGYVRFDAPGIYVIDFITNDGVEAKVGGQVVGRFDGRQTCQETFATEVEVPKAGWYPLQILYFQRTKTSCLHMRSGLKGKRVTWMPNKAFGH